MALEEAYITRVDKDVAIMEAYEQGLSVAIA